MDPAYPDSRLLAIINEFKAVVISTDPEERSRFDDADIREVTVTEDLPKHLEEHGLPVPRDQAWKMSGVQPGDLAVVAFTSGSTGKPKGVLHYHGRLTSEHQSYIWNMEYKGGSRILQFGSYAFHCICWRDWAIFFAWSDAVRSI
ncbi:AMP-dependent synthetase/ligase [Cordyceps fumosorosea ARSEF 2679]|uniref:AMP-dependent synthetase/ligase n=1 Tax=Cordyceps fumosorosea (strain ARSEF 2679) TaxID=1081104 RepID=A0A162IFF8_CORFA|nr:AMP-dependent synthetase/ligase [Cordyceps fumosorosea ARSEF 2679]OAA56385.1 AMP-dependent synthetase/ligase [Cordyceps fumosorosea ARSEF 2679]